MARAWAFALAFLLLATATAWADGVLHRGNRYEPATLDPHKMNTVYEASIAHDLFEGLVGYAPDSTLVPALAERWAPAPDGLSWTFHLRPGLVWSDGRPLTSADVVYSFRRLVTPETAAVFAPLVGVIKNARPIIAGKLPPEQLGVAAPDAGTIVVSLESPAPYLPELAANVFLAVVPRHVIDAFGPAWIRPEHAVTNGAFTLTGWVPHGAVTLARNARYREAAQVALEVIEYAPTEDTEAAITRFRAGELDMQLEFPASRLEELRRSVPQAVHVTPALATSYIAFNNRRPPFDDPRVRRALSMAIDRTLLVTRVLRDGQTAATGWVPPAMPGYAPAVMDVVSGDMETRRAEAKRLLAAAGYGPDRPLKFSLSLTTAPESRRTAIAIAAMWRAVGAIAALEGTEGKVLFANLRQGDYDTGLAVWSADYRDPVTFLDVLRTGIASNYSRYANPAYDALLARAANAASPEARAALLHEAEAVMLHDQPLAPLTVAVFKALISPRVHGWQPNPLDVHPSRYLSVDRGGGGPQ